MRGVPNLNGVRFLYAGVRNTSNPNPQSGEIWINDIYVGDVIKDVDHAERLSANFSVAGGAISFGGNWARTGADYRGLRQTRGAGANLSTLGLNARTDLQYFLPLAGFSLPLTGTYSQFRSLPKYPPNSDTEILDPGVSDSLRTQRIVRGFNVSLARRTPSRRAIMKYTIDRILPTFQYSDQRGISPAVRDTSTSMQGAVSYQINFGGNPTVPLLGKNRFRWWINQFDISSSATRDTRKGWSFSNGEFRPDPYQYAAAMTNQGSVRYNPFQSLETTFNMTVNRDLALEQLWKGVNIGQEISRSNGMRVSFVSPNWPVLRLLEKPSVEVQSSYSEDSSPNVRREEDPEGTRNVSASRNDTGRLGFDVGKQFTRLFNGLGWDVSAVPGGRGLPPPSGAPADTTQPGVAAADTTRPRPSLGGMLRGVGRIFTTVRPLKGSFQHRTSSSYLRIPTRPDWSYQFGIDLNTGVEVDGQPLAGPDSRNQNLTFSVESGVQLRSDPRGDNLDVQGRFSRSRTNAGFRANKTESVSRTWPDLQGKWDRLETLRVLRPAIKSGELRVDYRETRVETGRANQPPTTTTETFTLAPSLLFLWKNDLNTNLTVAIGENSSETRGSRSVTDNLNVGLDLRKNFRGGGGVGLFGKSISWTNQLEASLRLAYTRSGGERFERGSSLGTPVPVSTSFSVEPQARYTFSNNVSGSAFAGYTRSSTDATGRTTTLVRLGVTAVITF
jgi:hypothetical protein